MEAMSLPIEVVDQERDAFQTGVYNPGTFTLFPVLTISDFPILAREWRSRFRRDRAFILFAFLIGAATWAMMKRLGDVAPSSAGFRGGRALAPLSQDLLVQLVWTQIVGVCLLAPMLSSPMVARERKSGALGDLLLSPMSSLRLALEKWAASGVFLLLVLIALWPLDLVALLLGNSPIAGMLPVALLGLGCLAWGSALGLACSAHARRAATALRSAVGIVVVWLAGSLVCALMAGETSAGGGAWGAMPLYLKWFGRTNPILCALDFLNPSPFNVLKWPFCAGFLLLGSVLFLVMAERGLRKPLPDLPLIERKSGKRGGVSGALARMELPLVGRFAPSNPVLGREARGKFRLRQPPIAVLIFEIVLALGVCGLYITLAIEAIRHAPSREIIFWGVAWTGFFVSVLAASSQGGAALARERENGTWQALQLSMLSASQIVRGKLVAALATSLLLSLPVWPLLIVCVSWNGAWSGRSVPNGVQPFQLVACVLIWLGVLWGQTLVGILCSARAKKSGGAIGMATILALAWMLGSTFFMLLGSSGDSGFEFLAVTNPLIALAAAVDPPRASEWVGTGWPFAVFSLLVGVIALRVIESDVANSMNAERALN